MLLILVPFMPSLPLAILVLLLRFSISQMDVPTRQSYTMAVVDPDERSAAAGVTGVWRAPSAHRYRRCFAGLFMSNPAFLGLPFVISGAVEDRRNDLPALYFNFRTMKPPEELTVHSRR